MIQRQIQCTFSFEEMNKLKCKMTYLEKGTAKQKSKFCNLNTSLTLQKLSCFYSWTVRKQKKKEMIWYDFVMIYIPFGKNIQFKIQ